MRRIFERGLLAAVMGMASVVHAQEGDPYGRNAAQAFCALNPYVGATGIIVCVKPLDADRGISVAPTVYTFGEGVVHAPGSELAWVILTNFNTAPQTVLVELLVSGRALPVRRTVTLAPKARKDLSLHDLPELDTMATFSTSVYFPLDLGHASLVLRPLADSFSRVTLPPPTVMRLGQ